MKRLVSIVRKLFVFSCITRGNGFHPKEYTHVCFRFGYTKRTMLFELESITIGVGNTNWGAPDNECVFIKGADWQSKQSPWISVKGQLPDENEDIIILCKHGAIFNGTYSNNVWFCMDGYIYDTYKGNPIYSSMSSIPPSWEPIAWMPKPKFEE